MVLLTCYIATVTSVCEFHLAFSDKIHVTALGGAFGKQGGENHAQHIDDSNMPR